MVDLEFVLLQFSQFEFRPFQDPSYHNRFQRQRISILQIDFAKGNPALKNFQLNQIKKTEFFVLNFCLQNGLKKFFKKNLKIEG